MGSSAVIPALKGHLFGVAQHLSPQRPTMKLLKQDLRNFMKRRNTSGV